MFSIPIKTKIAAWIMFSVGLAILIFSLYYLMQFVWLLSLGCPPNDEFCNDFIYRQLIDMICRYVIPTGVLFLLVGGSLAYRKKYGWWFGTVSIFLFEIFYALFVLRTIDVSVDPWLILILPPVLVFIAFFLLIADRKNYFIAVDGPKK